MIALIDRLAAYAAREAESEDPEETKRQEELAARRLAEKVKVQKAKARENGAYRAVSPSPATESSAWGTASTPQSPAISEQHSIVSSEEPATSLDERVSKGKEKEGSPVRKFRGVPEDVQLFEVFWKQVVELIKARLFANLESPVSLIAENIVLGTTRSVDPRHYSTPRVVDQPFIKLLP